MIVDVSGSMNEMGKIHLQRNLCRFASQLKMINQLKYTELNIKFFQWTEKISEIEIEDDGAMPYLKPKGSTDLIYLSDFLLSAFSNDHSICALILSDGNFAKSDVSIFQDQVKTLPNLLLRTVAIGADADILKLKKISSNNSIYFAENISAAIDSAIFGTDESVVAPKAIDQIKIIEPAEPEEDWDD